MMVEGRSVASLTIGISVLLMMAGCASTSSGTADLAANSDEVPESTLMVVQAQDRNHQCDSGYIDHRRTGIRISGDDEMERYSN